MMVASPVILSGSLDARGKESSFVHDQATEALNFQITLFGAYLISFVLIFFLIGLVLLPAVVIVHYVYGIMGSIRANAGVAYRYPINIRFVT